MTHTEKIIVLRNLQEARRAICRAFHISPDPHLIPLMSTLGNELARIEDEPIEPE